MVTLPRAPCELTPGSIRQLANYQNGVHHRGLAVAVAGPPATTLWQDTSSLQQQTRVRMSIITTLTWTELNDALTILVDVAIKHKITGIKRIGPDTEKLPIDDVSADLENENISVDQTLMRLVEPLAQLHSLPTDIGAIEK
ncbi:hypothetical protein LTR49_026796 [Elasticomyces elasticus]|nr:hypothetical protein LTR49_026796 [Elasticomyces elasticus]